MARVVGSDRAPGSDRALGSDRAAGNGKVAGGDNGRDRLLFDTVQVECLLLQLTVEDRETIDELCCYPEGREREHFALSALRIGMLALRQARGRIDVDLIQRETRQMLATLEHQFSDHARRINDDLAGALRDYFDPESGRFNERVKRLVEKDGELDRILRSQVGTQDSELAKTLLAHVGEHSPLMRILKPDESQGLLAALRESVGEQLRQQRDRVLSEFSLNNKEGALSRLVRELTDNHGQLTEQLQGKIDEVVKEFSLADDSSFFSRLQKTLDLTSQAIHTNLTLDDEQSSLARLKRELLGILDKHAQTNAVFQEEVKVTLAQMKARREEAARSPRHGLAFEDAVCEALERLAQQQGDVIRRTGNNTGLIKNCKIGDAVIELSPESAAPGALIVAEAKEKAGCALADARCEIEQARKNRDAQVGLFVFSKLCAPAGLEEVARYGSDVFVVWDAEEPATDLYLRIGLTLARALSVRSARQNEAQVADFAAITEAILEVEKQARFLGEVSTSAETIKNGSEKILERVRKTRASLDKQVETLQEKIQALRHSLAAPDAPAAGH